MHNNKIEGVIFDWAGTTVDFGCFAPVKVFVEIFKERGICVTLEEARKPMGMLKIDHIRTMLQMERIENLWQAKYGVLPNEDDVKALYERFEPMLLESLHKYAAPIEAVVETVATLRANGLKIGSTTGYTDKMMEIVKEGAAKNGYSPDNLVTPDHTNNCGRPYPYMIFRNMKQLGLSATWKVVKVGDTVSDIKEGVNAGVWSVGVVVGSSEMGLSEAEWQALSIEEKERVVQKTEAVFLEAGADFTITTMRELPELIANIEHILEQGGRPGAK